MGDALRRVAAVAQPLGEVDEAAGGVLGQALAGLLRLPPLGVGEGGAQQVALGGVAQVVEGKGGLALDGVGPVGADHDPVHVGGDQQRRVLQRHGVVEELAEGGVEVAVAALVLPGEAVLAPDVGPALAAAGLGGALLEGEPVAARVGGGGIFQPEQAAEVVEMGLGGRAFLQLDRPPFRDEVLGGHVGLGLRRGRPVRPLRRGASRGAWISRRSRGCRWRGRRRGR